MLWSTNKSRMLEWGGRRGWTVVQGKAEGRSGRRGLLQQTAKSEQQPWGPARSVTVLSRSWAFLQLKTLIPQSRIAPKPRLGSRENQRQFKKPSQGYMLLSIHNNGMLCHQTQNHESLNVKSDNYGFQAHFEEIEKHLTVTRMSCFLLWMCVLQYPWILVIVILNCNKYQWKIKCRDNRSSSN